jgi:hypothetical protein
VQLPPASSSEPPPTPPSAAAALSSSAELTLPTPDAAWLLTFLPFSRLSTDAANFLAATAAVASIPAGEVVVSPGDPPGLTLLRRARPP